MIKKKVFVGAIIIVLVIGIVSAAFLQIQVANSRNTYINLTASSYTIKAGQSVVLSITSNFINTTAIMDLSNTIELFQSTNNGEWLDEGVVLTDSNGVWRNYVTIDASGTTSFYCKARSGVKSNTVTINVT